MHQHAKESHTRSSVVKTCGCGKQFGDIRWNLDVQGNLYAKHRYQAQCCLGAYGVCRLRLTQEFVLLTATAYGNEIRLRVASKRQRHHAVVAKISHHDPAAVRRQLDATRVREQFGAYVPNSTHQRPVRVRKDTDPVSICLAHHNVRPIAVDVLGAFDRWGSNAQTRVRSGHARPGPPRTRGG